MKSTLLLTRVMYVLLACAVFAAQASAKDYMTKNDALKLAFAGAERIDTKTVTLSKEERARVQELVNTKTTEPKFTYYRGVKKGQTLGFAVITDVIGKTHPFTFMLVVSPSGAITMVEILAYREPRGGEVRQPSFLRQFKGKTIDSKLRIREDIKHVAGATLSCRAITDGIRIQLAYLTVLAPLVKEKAGRPAMTDPSDARAIFAARGAAGLPRTRLTRARYLMGTMLEILVYAPDRATADRAINRAFAEVAQLEDTFSTFQPDSDVSRLNRATAGQAVPVDAHVTTLLARCREFAAMMRGAFDITAGPLVDLWRRAAEINTLPTPEAIAGAQARVGIDYLATDPSSPAVRLLRAGVRADFGGVAKGYALDRAAAVLQAQGISGALLNFGGHILVAGLPPGRSYWTVEVRDPHDPWNPAKHLATVRLRRGSIATSADYARGLTIQGRPYSHIVDPRSGLPVGGMLSATIIAPTATDADALSTGLYVLGPREGKQVIEEHQLAALLVTEPGTFYRSEAFLAQEARVLASAGQRQHGERR
ncbi:MAG: FAD:protein FMN transferase [Armatimonadota bacterium]